MDDCPLVHPRTFLHSCMEIHMLIVAEHLQQQIKVVKVTFSKIVKLERNLKNPFIVKLLGFEILIIDRQCHPIRRVL